MATKNTIKSTGSTGPTGSLLPEQHIWTVTHRHQHGIMHVNSALIATKSDDVVAAARRLAIRLSLDFMSPVRIVAIEYEGLAEVQG